MDLRQVQGVGGVGDPDRGVVVAGDDQDRQGRARGAQVPEEVAPELDGVDAGQAAVEQVATDQQGVIGRGHAVGDDLLEDEALVLQQRVLVQHPAQMPIGGVQDAQGHGRAF